MNFIQLQNVSIFKQLELEERLLRADTRNFCIVNYGSPRAIVMGLSNQIESLLNLDEVRKDKIDIIKRFSGGGTVIIDPNTLFITFIMNKEDVDIAPFPEPILRWACEIYSTAWKIPNFHLKENDYCIGERKCGGNAQYIRKDRFVHHTSFLWDYSKENMRYLCLPEKRPRYRLDRSHEDFLTTIKEFGTHAELIEKLKKVVAKNDFDPTSLEQVPYRLATHFI
jgi:lipoate---protein ligase